MTEAPILFSGPMVRAILEGKKTQTRRVIKPQPGIVPPGDYLDAYNHSDEWCFWTPDNRVANTLGPNDKTCMWKCPYGLPGDRLWVRETLWVDDSGLYYARPRYCGDPIACDVLSKDGSSVWLWEDENEDENLIKFDRRKRVGSWSNLSRYLRSGRHIYAFNVCFAEYTDNDSFDRREANFRKRIPSIHMPRWASRITLEVMGVRAQRLQDISEEDAIAEGVDAVPVGVVRRPATWDRRQDFSQLWDIINAKRGYSWQSNPWVWAVEFRRVRP